ncbi:MAG: hypothetical protein ABSF34_22070, partial [Verrucomicrobiota bacterium]
MLATIAGKDKLDAMAWKIMRLMAAAFLTLAGVHCALGTEWLVSNLNDSGAGSLRAAITSATSGDTVSFAPRLKGTIALTTGELAIPASLAINGPGPKVISISGSGKSRIFDIGDGVAISGTVEISGLTLRDGLDESGSGGGAIYTAQDLALTDCVVTGNHSTGSGGGICNSSGTLALVSCDVAGNAAGGSGGGVYNFGEYGDAAL